MLKSRVEDTHFYSKNSIIFDEKIFDLAKPKVMGIVNCTPDSFYSASRHTNLNSIINSVEGQIESGAAIIDIGGNSTKPGSKKCSAKEEIQRTIPAIEEIRKIFPKIILSIDTFYGEVAAAAIDSGVNMINDVSGFSLDEKMFETLERHKVPYVLTHSKGDSETMQAQTHYANIFKEMCFYFSEKINILQRIGLNDLILDPGFGFAKTTKQNYEILNVLTDFSMFNLPLLVGFSRKSMIYKKLNCQPEEALNGTTILNTIALTKGAKILRVHDVKEAYELITLFNEMKN